MRFRILDLVLLVLVLAATLGAMLYGRQRAIAVYGDQEAQTEWDSWREDAKELSEGAGPVKRRVPKSVSPPALVLMRDYFGVCVVIGLSLTSILFLTTLAFVRGAFTSAPFVDRSPPEPKKSPSP
jgi:hypothetical protein